MFNEVFATLKNPFSGSRMPLTKALHYRPPREFQPNLLYSKTGYQLKAYVLPTTSEPLTGWGRSLMPPLLSGEGKGEDLSRVGFLDLRLRWAGGAGGAEEEKSIFSWKNFSLSPCPLDFGFWILDCWLFLLPSSVFTNNLSILNRYSRICVRWQCRKLVAQY